jgi:putative acetyltransferase
MSDASRWTVALEDTGRADVAHLLSVHEALMRAQTPDASCHVKSADDLVETGARLFALREAGVLLALGALVSIGPGHEELKSMHVAQPGRGRGVGRALLQAMLQDARARAVARISLETGSGDDHAAARALFARAGFTACGPYAGYAEDPLSAFMTLAL